MSTSTETDDVVLDIDSLKAFTIPKRKKSKTELLEHVSLESHEYVNDILPAIQQSYKDVCSKAQFQYARPRLVHNSHLQDTCKKTMKSNGYTDKELSEVFAFQSFDSQYEARQACESGLKVGNQQLLNCLGRSYMGVYLCKHADVISPEPLKPRWSGILVIFKVVKGRVKFVKAQQHDLEPSPNFDCHLMKVAGVETVSSSPRSLFENSQLYLYQYTEDSDIAESPRQICPYAIVDCYYRPSSGDVRMRSSHRVTSGIDASTGLNSAVDYPGSSQATFPPPPTKRPYRRTLDTTSASNAEQMKSKRRGSVNRAVDQNANSMATSGSGVNLGLANQSGAVPESVSSGREKSRRQFGLSNDRYTDDSSMQVVWSGQVVVNGSAICSAELLSRCHIKHRLCFSGMTLDVSNKLPLSSIQSRYLSHLSSDFCKHHEFIDADVVQYAYSVLQPAASDSGQLDLFIAYLCKSNAVSKAGDLQLQRGGILVQDQITTGVLGMLGCCCLDLPHETDTHLGGFVDFPNEQILLLLPDCCDAISSLGFKCCDEENKAFLHCIIVSKISQCEESHEDELSAADKVVSQSSCVHSTDALPSAGESSRKPLSCVSVRDPRAPTR